MAQLLESLAERQGAWSATASRLKSIQQRARWAVFALSILGALAAAIASQQEDPARQAWAITGGVLIAIGTLISARFLAPAKSAAGARARAASEALKRTSFFYATKAAPYDDPATRDSTLRADVERIETEVNDLLGEFEPAARGHTALAPLDMAGYLKERLQPQIEYYERSAVQSRHRAGRLRAIEFTLAITTAIITGATGATSKAWLLAHTGLSFDWVALAGVLTTISGAILTHIEASRYDFLVVSYLAAARRLRAERDAAPENRPSPSPELSNWVGACERVMAAENGSWVTKISAQASP